MWGLIISLFIALNVVSTVIILSACVVSGRQSRASTDMAQEKLSEQMELATAIAKLRQIEPVSVPVRA